MLVFFCLMCSPTGESDVNFYEEHMEIFVGSSKTPAERGCLGTVVIARSDSKLCPTAMLEQYQFVTGAGQITVQRSGDHKEGL